MSELPNLTCCLPRPIQIPTTITCVWHSKRELSRGWFPMVEVPVLPSQPKLRDSRAFMFKGYHEHLGHGCQNEKSFFKRGSQMPKIRSWCLMSGRCMPTILWKAGKTHILFQKTRQYTPFSGKLVLKLLYMGLLTGPLLLKELLKCTWFAYICKTQNLGT